MDEQRLLTFDLFAGRVGERFVLAADGVAPSTLDLVEATESTELGGTGADGVRRPQFSLVFRGGPEAALPQSSYRLAHADLGELELFLVPIGPDAGRMRYEAAFA